MEKPCEDKRSNQFAEGIQLEAKIRTGPFPLLSFLVLSLLFVFFFLLIFLFINENWFNYEENQTLSQIIPLDFQKSAISP